MKLTKTYEPGLEQETRTFELDSLEIRAEKDSEAKKIRGHAAVFNKLSEDLGGFREMFLPGAFADTIKREDIRSMYNHNPNYIIGRVKAGNLRIEEDEKGLYYEVSPLDTSYARDLIINIEQRLVTGCSIIFRIDGKNGERWLLDEQEVKPVDAFMAMWDGKKHKIERHVVKARLADVGPVTFPAYTQTDVSVRDYINALKETQEKLDKLGSPGKGTDVSLANLRWKLR